VAGWVVLRRRERRGLYGSPVGVPPGASHKA
jgi:hypothetical protein